MLFFFLFTISSFLVLSNLRFLMFFINRCNLFNLNEWILFVLGLEKGGYQSMWYKVLVAKHRVEGGRVRKGGLYDVCLVKGSLWYCWRWGQFHDGVWCRVSNGENTSFWCDSWVDAGVLRSRFSQVWSLDRWWCISVRFRCLCWVMCWF